MTQLRPHSHFSVFVSIRFRCIEATVHTAPFLYKNGEKNLRFCAFTLIWPITKTQRKTSVFVRSRYSVFVKLIVGYWSVFKNLRFCAFTLIKCVFKNLRFCGYPLLTAFSKTSVFFGVFVRISVNTFTKTEVPFTLLRFCTKTKRKTSVL